MSFPFLAIFIVFVLLLALRFSTVKKKTQEKYNNFWDNEAAANNAAAVDLSTLSYINVPINRFPFNKWEDDEIQMMEAQITELSKTRILNLTGKTNTDLKLQYGAANLDALTEIGENYNTLIILLVDYAKALMQKDDYEEAAKILEYGASIRSDISSNYMLLGDCYVALHRVSKIPVIRQQVESMDLLLGHKIVSYLDELTEKHTPEDFALPNEATEN